MLWLERPGCPVPFRLCVKAFRVVSREEQEAATSRWLLDRVSAVARNPPNAGVTAATYLTDAETDILRQVHLQQVRDSNRVLMKPSFAPYAEYIISVSVRDLNHSWEVVRRFSEFVSLKTQLECLYVSIPDLPPRTLGRSLNPNHLKSRVQGLDSFLRPLSNRRDTMCSKILHKFLGVDTNIPDVAASLFAMWFLGQRSISVARNLDPVWRRKINASANMNLLASLHDRNFGVQRALYIPSHCCIVTACNDFSFASKVDSVVHNLLPADQALPLANLCVWEMSIDPLGGRSSRSPFAASGLGLGVGFGNAAKSSASSSEESGDISTAWKATLCNDVTLLRQNPLVATSLLYHQHTAPEARGSTPRPEDQIPSAKSPLGFRLAFFQYYGQRITALARSLDGKHVFVGFENGDLVAYKFAHHSLRSCAAPSNRPRRGSRRKPPAPAIAPTTATRKVIRVSRGVEAAKPSSPRTEESTVAGTEPVTGTTETSQSGRPGPQEHLPPEPTPLSSAESSESFERCLDSADELLEVFYDRVDGSHLRRGLSPLGGNDEKAVAPDYFSPFGRRPTTTATAPMARVDGSLPLLPQGVNAACRMLIEMPIDDENSIAAILSGSAPQIATGRGRAMANTNTPTVTPAVIGAATGFATRSTDGLTGKVPRRSLKGATALLCGFEDGTLWAYCVKQKAIIGKALWLPGAPKSADVVNIPGVGHVAAIGLAGDVIVIISIIRCELVILGCNNEAAHLAAISRPASPASGQAAKANKIRTTFCAFLHGPMKTIEEITRIADPRTAELLHEGTLLVTGSTSNVVSVWLLISSASGVWRPEEFAREPLCEPPSSAPAREQFARKRLPQQLPPNRHQGSASGAFRSTQQGYTFSELPEFEFRLLGEIAKPSVGILSSGIIDPDTISLLVGTRTGGISVLCPLTGQPLFAFQPMAPASLIRTPTGHVELGGHAEGITSLQLIEVDADHKYLITTGKDGALHIWEWPLALKTLADKLLKD